MKIEGKDVSLVITALRAYAADNRALVAAAGAEAYGSRTAQELLRLAERADAMALDLETASIIVAGRPGDKVGVL